MSKKCIKCGTELDDNSRFCKECGAEQIISEDEKSEENKKDEGDRKSKESQTRKKAPIWGRGWFIFAMLILFFPLGLFLMWKYKKFHTVIRILITGLVILIAVIKIYSEKEDVFVDTTGLDIGEEKNSGGQSKKTDDEAEKGTSKIQDIYDVIDDYLNNDKDSDALKEIAAADKQLVWEYLAGKILEEVNDGSSDLLIKLEINKCNELYKDVFSESRQELDRCAELAEQLDQLTEQQEKIDEKYPFSISQAVTNIQHDRLYVTQRLETTYSDNILGKIQKEIESYMSENDSDWVAYNVVSNMGIEMPGEICYVLHSTQLNPFSYSDSYELTFYYSSETLTLQRSGGFEFEAPILYLIDDETQLYEDYESYQNAVTQHDELINEIIEINKIK